MSTLKQLIKKFCPQGVEYVRLGDVCNLIIGFAFKSNLFRDIGSPVCRTKDIQENKIDFSSMKCFNLNDYSNNLKKYIIEPNDIVIGMSGTIKVGINKTNKHCYLNQRVGKFVCDKTKIVDKFLYYFLCNSVSLITKKISDGSVKNLGNNDLLEMQIPLPSLPVQEEIVKILDKFTDLENELENELRMRKMQFNAYRDKLLTFDKNGGVKFEKLGDLTQYEQPNKYIVTCTEYRDSFDIPVLTAGDSFILGYTNEKKYIYTASNDNPVIIFDDFTGAHKWVNFPFKVKSSAIKIIKSSKKSFMLKYLFYLMERIDYKHFEHRRLWINIYSELTIPVPPLEKQKEIVEKLDKFNDMCNEISDGLPLEIELRKKLVKLIFLEICSIIKV